MISEARKQSMAWMETNYSKHTHFRWKIKWRLEHLGALGILGKKFQRACVFPKPKLLVIYNSSRKFVPLETEWSHQKGLSFLPSPFLRRFVSSLRPHHTTSRRWSSRPLFRGRSVRDTTISIIDLVKRKSASDAKRNARVFSLRGHVTTSPL